MQPKGSLAGKHVLIAEDQYLIADELSLFFAELGAKVIGPFPSSAEARKILADMPVDYAVLDIALAGDEVYPLARELRDRGVPLLFLTGFDADGIRAEFADVPTLTKPHTNAGLLSMMRQLGWIAA